MTEQDNVNALSARMLVTDLVLRSVLLKINSEKAHESMKHQIKSQLWDLKEHWCGKKANISGLGNYTFKETLMKDLEKEFSDIVSYGDALIDALFSVPNDLEYDID